MNEVEEGLFVGDEADCFYDKKEDWAVVHACKSPCHQHAVGYRGNLNRNHPNYLIQENESHLFLNMVDMNMTLSHEFTEPIITTALDFIEKHTSSRSILIHCNLAQSRSPALALVFLAKRKNTISNESYAAAKEEFIKLYPQYAPGRDVESYLTNYWGDLQ